MQISLLLQIARKHLTSRIKQTVIASLGVTFGIGTFIILVSFMTGLNGLLDGLILDRTPHIRIYNETKASPKQPIDFYQQIQNSFNVVHSVKPKQGQTGIHNALQIIRDLKHNSDVKGVTPEVMAQAFYLSGTTELNGIVNGVDILEESRLFNLHDYVIEGSVKQLAQTANGIILGAGVAQKMSVEVGDRIQISGARGLLLYLKVVGIYQSGLAEIDNVQSYANIQTAQQILGKPNNYITDIHLKLYDMDLARAMANRLKQHLQLSAIDIKTANAQFDTGTQIRNTITYAVSITLLIVAGFGIYNILNMLIYEKMNDIAILKATGFSGKDVKFIFISQAIIIGVIGGIFGLMLGYGVSVLVDHAPFETEALPTIKTYPVNFDPMFYIIGISFALLTTFFSGYLPARKAQKIDPVNIIRRQ